MSPMPTSPDLVATVLLPTSIDRGPTLALAVDSVLRQTVRELELFIIGDGVNPETRRIAEALAAGDPRVRFFDFPKGASRSEARRHEVLAGARGRIVCYQIDRDLWLPDHVAEMARLLADADMAHTLTVRVKERGFDFSLPTDLGAPEGRVRLVRRQDGLPLPMGAHTLAAYRRLAEGWATTPPGWYTDCYFWAKFARDPAMRCVGSGRLTVLNLQRGPHPGWSTERRLVELRAWAARLAEPDGPERIRAEVADALAAERARTALRLDRAVLLWGLPLNRTGLRELRVALEEWAWVARKRYPHRLGPRLLAPVLSWMQRRAIRRLAAGTGANASG